MGRCFLCANGNAEGDFFQEAKADLAKCSAAIIPVHDIDHIVLTRQAVNIGRQAVNIGQDDEMSRETAFELIVVFFMEIGVVDIEISEPCPDAIRQVAVEIMKARADEVGAFCPDLVTE